MSFCNHDIVRTVTRFGGGAAGDPRLAKLMLALLFSLRGTVLLYQGEELGLPEVDLERHQLRDPVGDLYYPIAKGRDGCRTPMPWDAAAPNLGFTSGTPWLPLGAAHKPARRLAPGRRRAVDAQLRPRVPGEAQGQRGTCAWAPSMPSKRPRRSSPSPARMRRARDVRVQHERGGSDVSGSNAAGVWDVD